MRSKRKRSKRKSGEDNLRQGRAERMASPAMRDNVS